MKSITIHEIDLETSKALDALATKVKLSLSQLVKRLLEKPLGLKPKGQDHRNDFAEFCGSWSAQEAEDFNKTTECFGETLRLPSP
jgi:hypothetical protein